MSGNFPFGFGAGSGSGDEGPGNPFGGTPGPGGDNPFDMSQLGAMLQHLGEMLQNSGKGLPTHAVDWDLAKNVARQGIASEGDPSVNANDVRRVDEAFGIAQIWLDGATTFPAGSTPPATWSRSEWLEATFPAWREFVEPVAEGMTTMFTTLPGGGQMDLEALGLPQIPGMEGMANDLTGPLLDMGKRLGAALFGAQIGSGLAALAGDVLGASDVTIPLTSDGRPALVSENAKSFGADLGLELSDVYLYLALREAAHQRLYAHVPWLRTAIETALKSYASGITIDTSRIEEGMKDIDVNSPDAMQELMSSGIFEPAQTEEQQQALTRLETLLALVEGWVQDVVEVALGERLPAADRLAETMRRRRASGGPAERTFATLVGLEMRPRRLREAHTLWQKLREERGVEGRDGIWRHPDLIPSDADLEDPESWLAATDEMDG